MFAEIKEKYGGVDVCINNAGLAHLAPLLEGKTEDWKHMFEVSSLAQRFSNKIFDWPIFSKAGGLYGEKRYIKAVVLLLYNLY